MPKICFIICCLYVFCIQPYHCNANQDMARTSEGNSSESYENSTSQVEVETTLQDLEQSMKDFMDNIFKRAFPYVSKVGIPQYTSTMCLLNLARVYFGLKKLEPWAFKMMDSSGKLSGGLLEGTASALGDYDECQDVIIGGKPHPRARRGSYCLLKIKPPEPITKAMKEYQINKGKGNISLANSKSFLSIFRKFRLNPDHVMFRMGICMSSACDVEDVQDIVDMVSTRVGLSVEVLRCEYKKSHEFQVHEILIMVFLCNVIALTLVGTLVELFYNRGGCIKEDNSVLEPGPDVLKLRNKWRKSKLFEILSNFSLCSSIQRLFVCNEEGDALDVIRGIKVLTVISAIYAHTYVLALPVHFYRFRDTLNFAKFIDEVLFSTIANSSVGVDTLFFLAGFLFIFYRWRLLKRPPVFQYLLKFLSVSYVRMLAAQILVVFIFALFPIFGSGPLWHEFVEEPLQNCAKTSWMNVLFIQNFLGPYDSCLNHTWILATIMQLFVFTSILVWIMHRKPMVGISVSVALTIAAGVAVCVVTVIEDFPATFAIYFYNYRTYLKYWKYVYVQAYNHIGPFVIGMLCAFYITEYPPLKPKKAITVSLWIISLVTCCAIIFGLYHYRDDQDMNRFLAVFYAAVHRPIWALAIGWIVYACATDNGGFINSILTWKALIPVERLCYLAYLLHIPLMYYHGGVQRERMFMGHYNQVMCFFSYATASFLLSFACYVLFQYPYQTIESYVFGVHKENIWQVEPSATSTETLKTEDGDKEEQDKVLYSRYEQNATFSHGESFD